ncbi:hypothetical protein GUJ93_ZPchr0011g28920 [Zizania palustris]|uniref:Uncharacterized protein n=1 Tax=Zizania palustris TaxID=103762 RepID=A0A8J5WH41_ZIZPA|nr:hypothetical protein GUJ93_ZPchr0011g28920 [Zizania palustris]
MCTSRWQCMSHTLGLSATNRMMDQLVDEHCHYVPLRWVDEVELLGVLLGVEVTEALGEDVEVVAVDVDGLVLRRDTASSPGPTATSHGGCFAPCSRTAPVGTPRSRW